MTTAHPLLELSVLKKREIKIRFDGTTQGWNDQ
ncbi:hypothetical protein ACVIHD_000146 [Bradyrhizobium embrapense]